MYIENISGGEINGNKGDDEIVVNGNIEYIENEYGSFEPIGDFDRVLGSDVRGGQGNDFLSVRGFFFNSAIYGDKGDDFIEFLEGGYIGSAAYGGEGNDVIDNVLGDNLQLWGGAGDDEIYDRNAGGASGVTIDGGEGNDIIVSASDSGATSTINAGTGADEVSLISEVEDSAGSETYVFESGDSVAATATSFVGTTLATNDVITFGKAVDFLGSASSEDKIDIDFTPESIDNINNESIFDSLNSGDVYEVQGDYVPGPNEFTVNDAGADYLYILGSGRERIENIFTSSTNILISDEQIALDQFV